MKTPKGYLSWQEVFGKVFISGSGGGSTPPVDKEFLGSTLQELEIIHPQEGDYTPETWAPFFNAWEQAKLVYADEEATQEQVDSVVDQIIYYYVRLEEYVEPEDLECVYVLDGTEAQVDILSQATGLPLSLIESEGECGHIFPSQTYSTDDTRALNSEAVWSAFFQGQTPDREFLFPPEGVTGIIAYEIAFKFNLRNTKGVNNDSTSIFLGPINPTNFDYMVTLYIETPSQSWESDYYFPYMHFRDMSGASQAIGIGLSNIYPVSGGYVEGRAGILFDTTTGLWGAIVRGGGGSNVQWGSNLVPLLDPSMLQMTLLSSYDTPDQVTFEGEWVVNGSKLELTGYPEGTVGLDGVLVGG